MTAAIVIFALAVCLSATMAVAWLMALRTGRSGWIDAIWSFATGVFGAAIALIPLAGAELSWRQMLVAALALAWSLRDGGVISIPKAAGEAHLRENAEVWKVVLTPEGLAELDGAFPPPKRKQPLEML